jgi:hypothetical protein
MPLDQSKLGNVVQQQMEAIEADHGDAGEIGDIVVIVQVIRPDQGLLEIRVRGTDEMLPNARVGLIAQALRNELLGGQIDQSAG